MSYKKSEEIIKKMDNYRKYNSIIVSKLQSIERKKQAGNIDCCTNQFYLETYYKKQIAGIDNKHKIKPVFTCKNKFCSNCAYLRSRKFFCDTYKVLEKIKEDNINFLGFHLTLTVKNPEVENYTKYFTTMNNALKLFLKSTSKYKFKNYVLGYQASRETTQSPEAKRRNELHPHIHILLLMKPEFAYKNNSYKLTQKEILQEWNSCLKHYDKDFPESSQIAFKKIKNKEEAEASVYGTSVDLQNSAISEVSKYPVKISDLVDMSEEHFNVLYNALDHARLITFGGIIKQYRAYLKIKEDNVVDMFLNEKEYELAKVQMFRLFNEKFKEYPVNRKELLHYEIVKSGELHKAMHNPNYTTAKIEEWKKAVEEEYNKLTDNNIIFKKH